MTVEKKTAAAPAEASDFPLTLVEFCTRLSARDRRVEMIGAFEAAEKIAGHNKDTEANFAARYEEFLNQPA